MRTIDYDLLSIQEARVLAENAYEAQRELAAYPQSKLNEIVEAMAKAVSPYCKELAMMSAEETDYGNWQDKLVKNRFATEYLPKQLENMECVGIIADDKHQKIMTIGVPMGVIVNICPATSPVSSTINIALIAIKSGNAVVFSPHPRAKNSIAKVLDIMTHAAYEAGLPECAISYLETVTSSGVCELMKHKNTSLIINAGLPKMLKVAYEAGKPVIYGGNGNGPVFVEKTANIEKAAKDIISSKTFDYGVISGAEQSIVVDKVVARKLQNALEANGAYFMNEEEADKLGSLFYHRDGSINAEMVGKSAVELSKKAGFNVPNITKVLVSPQKYVTNNNPYSKEKLCPVLAYYIEDDWQNACEKCIELLLSERKGHTLVIHSGDEEVIKQFALKKPVGRMLVNTPGTFGSIGITTNLFPAIMLGSGSAGEGITADNVSPLNLIYIRKVGYGVRNVEDLNLREQNGLNSAPSEQLNQDNLQMLQQIFEELIKHIKK